MSKINPDALIALFWQAHNEGWGYIWGGKGQTWTDAKQRAATREQTVKWGKKWIGKRVADCSGLFVWAFGQLGAPIYHGSNTIWREHLSAKGSLKNGCRLDGIELKPGTAVFLVKNGNRHHIGLYVGDGKVIEAKGTYYGVVQSSVSAWDEWGELIGVDYGAEGGDKIMRALRRGATGADVTTLQTALVAAGQLVEVDGKYGAQTRNAVAAYQDSQGLTADGVCGPLTWAALGITAPTTGDTDAGEELTAEEADPPTRAEFDALSDTVDVLKERLDALEGAAE